MFPSVTRSRLVRNFVRIRAEFERLGGGEKKAFSTLLCFQKRPLANRKGDRRERRAACVASQLRLQSSTQTSPRIIISQRGGARGRGRDREPLAGSSSFYASETGWDPNSQPSSPATQPEAPAPNAELNSSLLGSVRMHLQRARTPGTDEVD